MTTEAPAEETKPATAKTGQLSPKQWASIEARWKAGTVSYGDLVREYGRSVSTFARHFRRYGIVKGSDAAKIKAKVAAAVEQEAVNDAQLLAARIRETKDEHYKMSTALARLTWKEVLETKQAARPMASALNNLKALDAAASALRKCREERFAVLGLDRTDAVDPDAIPELILTELTPEQIKALRERDHTELEDSPVVLGEDTTSPASAEDEDVVDESE